MNNFNASPQQTVIFSWIENGQGSAIIEAVAGAGKTTTLVKSLELMLRHNLRVFLGAYNKKIAEEIKEKAPQHKNLIVSTMHAAGWNIWRKSAPKCKIDNNKCRNIYRAAQEAMYVSAGDAYDTDTKETVDKLSMMEKMKQFEGQVLSLVSYAKQAAVGFTKNIDDTQVYLDLIDHFNIDCLEEEQFVIKMAKRLLKGSINRDYEVVDFDDMILAPLVHKAKPYTYDWVLIDEAQDTNASRRALALMMLKRGGRLIAVGDPRQAIYGFTGADADSLDLIAKAVNATRLPLTVTYRCPKNVVNYAKQWVNHIEAHESAPDGIVRTLDATVKVSTEAKPGDAILCRFNAPLIQQVYEFIAAGVPAKVEGREIGSGLKTLARRWKSRSYDALQVNLENFMERETAKFRAKEEETKAVAVEDKVNCLLVIMERAKKNSSKKNPVEAICDEIDAIFSDNIEGGFITLASIHKSKGREWNRVFWMQTGPSKWARQQWEMEQEDNLCYVAATRAKKELVLFTAPAKKEQK